MGSYSSRRCWGLALGLAVLCAAAPLYAQTGGLTGKCSDEKGQPMVGYTIVVERTDIKWASKVKTNKKGEYTYIGLAPSTYKLTLTDPTGRAVFNITHHVGIGDPTQVDFDMAKERSLAQKEQQANPEFQKKLEEQSKEQKQFSGLKGTFDQGQALYDQQKYAEAAAVFEQALPMAKDKNVPIVLAKLADCYHKARQYDKAMETYQKAIEANPSDASLHNNLGSLYADMGKIDQAQAEFQKAAEMDPTGAGRYYYNLGVTMYNKGKMDEAAVALKKSVDINPNFADAYYLEAQALLGKATMSPDGKVVPVAGTVEALQSYLKLDPNGKWAQAAKDSLNLLTGKVETEYKKKKKG
jgi:tetratricopeptide (TPR) repeat protein